MPAENVLYDVCTDGSLAAGDVRAAVVGAVLGIALLAVVWRRPDRCPRVFALGLASLLQIDHRRIAAADNDAEVLSELRPVGIG